MKRVKKILLISVLLVLLGGYLVFAFVGIHNEEKSVKPTNISVKILNPEYSFVNKEEVLNLANKQIGNWKETVCDSINRNKIEELLLENPFVEDVQVFRTATNGYQVEIMQRTPFLRVLTDKEDYYLDKEGVRLPTGVKYPTLVHIYRGAVTEPFAKSTLLEFEKYLTKKPFWSDMIDHVRVDAKGNLELFLRVKSGAIYLGDLSKLDEKFSRLLLFMDKVGKHNGMEAYERIDLRFNNRVVVKKK